MKPFDYPAKPHERRHGPQGYASFESFRPWLRDEFDYRCIYCLRREAWGPRRGSFHVDHFVPQFIAPSLTLAYENLLYACCTCNLAKGNRSLADPTRILLSDTVAVAEDGTIASLTAEARRTIRRLGLDSAEFNEFRRLWIGIVSMGLDESLLALVLGYPRDLPDLALLEPPLGNSRSEGLAQSAYARQVRGTLPAIY